MLKVMATWPRFSTTGIPTPGFWRQGVRCEFCLTFCARINFIEHLFCCKLANDSGFRESAAKSFYRSIPNCEFGPQFPRSTILSFNKENNYKINFK